METKRINARDVFINLGAIVALYTVVVSLVNLLFTAINTAYPKIQNGYNYFGSESISWPVATLIIFFPIFILLMWLLEKDYRVNPEKQTTGIHRWLSYLTLFFSGIMIAADLITVLYYFIDGRELTTGFLLKILVLLVIGGLIFAYYLTDIMGRLNKKKRMTYRIIALAIVLLSIVWGFAVLGSPATQRQYKYDEQKVNDLMQLNNEVMNHYSLNEKLPESLSEVRANYHFPTTDSETGKAYEYIKTGETTYELCAEFNKESRNQGVDRGEVISFPMYPYGNASWEHGAGRHCFPQIVNPNIIVKPMMVR